MAEPIIKIENVNFWYDKGKEYQMQAAKDINLEINKGEYVAFFGPSGSGKTTLLYLIAGVEPCQDGKILINGRDISKFSKQELAIYRQIGVGIIFQQFNLIPTLTVLSNVALPMSFLGISEGKRKEEAMKILTRLDIAHLAGRLPHELSGGQQQRVGIARALANNPPIIIADEPLGNLDSENSEKVLSFLRELHEQDNRTIIMVTHEAWSLKDVEKIFYTKDGQVMKTERTDAKSLAALAGGEKSPHNDQAKLDTVEEVSQSLAGLLLRGYTKEEMKRFETCVNDRLSGKIKEPELLQLLDKSFKQGGVGLWKQKALKVSAYVEDIVHERQKVADIYKELHRKPQAPPLAEVMKVREWLLLDYTGHLDSLQQQRFDELLTERMRNVITGESFQEILNLPKTKFGVGLSLHTSQRMTERFEAALGGLAIQ